MSAHRVVLRHLRPEDAPAFMAYRNDPEVARFQAWTLPYTQRHAAALIDAMQARTPGQPGWTQLALVDAQTDELLGDFAVNGASPARAHRPKSASRWPGMPRAGAGLRGAGAAAGTPVRPIRPAPRLRPYRSAQRPAAALLTRASFRHEGTALESYWHRGEWTDDALYGLLAREWQA